MAGRRAERGRGGSPRLLTALAAATFVLLAAALRLRRPCSAASLDGMLSSADGPPASFDWQAYLRNYPELLQPPASLAFTASDAWRHYSTEGRVQGRIPSKLNLRLRYGTSGGLSNQLVSHLSAFMVARQAGADLVLPLFLGRASFLSTKVPWRAYDIGSIFNVGRMQDYWASRGMVVHQTPAYNASLANDIGWHQPPGGLPPSLYDPLGCTSLDMPRPSKFLAPLADHVRIRALGYAEASLRAHGSVLPCINIDTGSTFFLLNVTRDQHLAQSTFCEGFFFNESIVQLADEVRQRIGGPYNGVHLRLEPDAAGFNRAMGGEWLLAEYVRAMKQAAFKSTAMVYAASGLLYDGPSNEFGLIVHNMTSGGVARKVVHKESLLGRDRLRGLHSEQLALLDLLVLTGSQAFVGHPFSTMSVLVEHLRTCQGVDRRTAHYITVKHPRLDEYVASYSAHLQFMGDFKPHKPGFKPQVALQAGQDAPPPSQAPPPTIPAAAP